MHKMALYFHSVFPDGKRESDFFFFFFSCRQSLRGAASIQRTIERETTFIKFQEVSSI